MRSYVLLLNAGTMGSPETPIGYRKPSGENLSRLLQKMLQIDVNILVEVGQIENFGGWTKAKHGYGFLVFKNPLPCLRVVLSIGEGEVVDAFQSMLDTFLDQEMVYAIMEETC